MGRPTGRIVYTDSETKWFVGDREVSELEFKERFPDKPIAEPLAGQQPGAWPMASEALAVHPSQAAEATAAARAAGVPTEFDKTGRPIFTDRAHRREFLKYQKAFDKAGGYAD